MKFFSAVFALASLAAVSAQNIAIGAPADGSSVSAGSQITVQVLRPNSLTGSQEVAVAISVLGCQSYQAGCPDPTQVLGTTLYSGGFDPEYPPAGTRTAQDQPGQNFTVTLPGNLQSGAKAQLSVTHLSLVGAGPFPLMEVKSVTLNVN